MVLSRSSITSRGLRTAKTFLSMNRRLTVAVNHEKYVDIMNFFYIFNINDNNLKRHNFDIIVYFIYFADTSFCGFF